MAKPRLEKVRALFYVLQHIQEGASNFDTPSVTGGWPRPTEELRAGRSFHCGVINDARVPRVCRQFALRGRAIRIPPRQASGLLVVD